MLFLSVLVALLSVANCMPAATTTKRSTTTTSHKTTAKTTAKSTVKTTAKSTVHTTSTLSKALSSAKTSTSIKPTTSVRTIPTSISSKSSSTTSTTTISTSVSPTTCTSVQSATSIPTGQALSISVTALGTTNESGSSFSYTYGRDGGGGGLVNGHHIVIFSDTLVNGFGPITNTMVYYALGSPTMVQDFGSGGIPNQAIPYIANETTYTQAGNGQTRVAIWPTTGLANLPGDNMHAIGVAGVSIQSSWTSGLPSYEAYNTLFTVTGGSTPSIARTVPVLFTNSTIQYGNFGTFLNPLDSMLYFFVADGTSGLKVARASTTSYTEITTWNYWDGASWQSQPLLPGATGNLIDGSFSSGDIFFSPKYGTFMAVYFLADVDSTFRYRYILPDANGTVSLTGTWSDEFVLYDTSALVDGGYGFNYAGHVYPHDDPCGRNLTMSITLSDGVTPYFFQAIMS